jgi:SPP1 family predicted phage head-tail adaptor
LISAGTLRKRITLQRSTTEQDGRGRQTVIWTDVAKKVWAGINPITGREQFSADATQAEVSHIISVRYRDIFADPKTVAAMRALYKPRGSDVVRIFNIHACLNVDERNFDVQLLCSEGLNAG